MHMKVERILATRANRETRLGRPFKVFNGSITQCMEAGRSLLSEPTQAHSAILERAVVITAVTAIEVYYKDVIDGIFRICSPSFFEPHLKKLHGAKYDITDLLQFHAKSVHPLELISASQSFQNIESIDAVFSTFLGKGLLTELLKLRLRVADKPETEIGFEPKDLENVKRLFALRHELVHDPSQVTAFNQQCYDQLHSALILVCGSEALLMPMIFDNKDPELILED